MKNPREVILRKWAVYLLKRKAERLPFTVTARDSEEAIKRAIEEPDIPERERFRVSVQREAKPADAPPRPRIGPAFTQEKIIWVRWVTMYRS
jgi:hypothetical protein